MRVLHVLSSLGPLRGGPSFALPPLVRALARVGVDVEIVTTDDNAGGKLDVVLHTLVEGPGGGYWVRYFPRQHGFYTFSWPLNRWLQTHMHEYDLIHTHALFSFAPTAAAWWAYHSGIPYVCRPLGTLDRWGFEHRRPRLKRLSFGVVERRVLEHAARVHFTSEQELAEARERGVRFRPVVIPLGIDLAPLAQLPAASRILTRFPALNGKRIILFLSRIDRKKGLDLMLPAFAAISETIPDTILVLAGYGDPEFERELRALCLRLRIEKRVVWTGFLDGEDKRSAFAAASVFVLPSYSENFGVAAVEALAAGIPVLISDRVGISPQVSTRRAGRVVACDVAALAQAVRELLEDPNECRALAANGRQLAAECYSSDVAARALLSLYQEIIP